MTNEEVFTKIYQTNSWGINKKDKDGFYSGPGSYGSHAKQYVTLINDFIITHNITSLTDIGCGDFAIGSQITMQNPSLQYKGCDVVKFLVEKNREKFGSERIKFYHLDAATEPLPNADLLTIREVLQHLSNNSITQILQKTKKFRYVIITERLFKDEYVKKYNKDKPAGPDVRLLNSSGVYIDKPPFNIPCNEILCCRVDVFGKEAYFKSFLIKNNN
ncbi:MAG: class I SAM-dependent methyltransferase [Parafilimonas sp.]